jgi:hypothetical protein
MIEFDLTVIIYGRRWTRAKSDFNERPEIRNMVVNV